MSIFEPIPRESAWDDDGTQEFEDVPSNDGSAPAAGSFDPRSIMIAGLVVIAIVIAGLVASNTADPESRPEPLVPSRVNPGAAAVEQVEAKRSAPTTAPSASPSVEPVDEADGDAQVDAGDDTQASGGFKWDSKPGKGHGRDRG